MFQPSTSIIERNLKTFGLVLVDEPLNAPVVEVPIIKAPIVVKDPLTGGPTP